MAIAGAVACGPFALSACSGSAEQASTTPPRAHDPPAATATTASDEKERQCEAVYPAAKLTAYAGYPYKYANVDDPTRKAGQFTCRYATTEGPGERVVEFSSRPDRDKSEFSFIKRVAQVLPAPEYGDGFYETSSYKRPEETALTVSWRLTAHKDGTLYEVVLIQYKSEAETKAVIKEIFDSLTRRQT